MLKIILTGSLLCVNLAFSAQALADMPTERLDKIRSQAVLIGCSISDEKGNIFEDAITGSGFVVGNSDHIVTNRHVVEPIIKNVRYKCSKIKVLSPPAIIDSTLEYAAEEKDIAILKLPLKLDVNPVEFNTHAEIGEDLIAVGFPGSANLNRQLHNRTILTLDDAIPTSTYGKISSIGFQLENVSYYQTDAAINHGNSGGPSFNRYGQVIGINSMRAIDGDIGFPMLVSELLPILKNLNIPYVAYDAPPAFPENLKYVWEDKPEYVLLFFVLVILAGGVIYLAYDREARIKFIEVMSRPHTPTSSDPSRIPMLRVLSGPDAGQEVSLDNRKITIGRNQERCNLPVPKNRTEISGTHASIEARKSNNTFSFVLRDENSQNGTFLQNGEKLQSNGEKYLTDGDRFYLASRDVMYQVFIKH